jgi:hypothetical protein
VNRSVNRPQSPVSIESLNAAMCWLTRSVTS